MCSSFLQGHFNRRVQRGHLGSDANEGGILIVTWRPEDVSIIPLHNNPPFPSRHVRVQLQFLSHIVCRLVVLHPLHQCEPRQKIIYNWRAGKGYKWRGRGRARTTPARIIPIAAQRKLHLLLKPKAA